jgi:hypothetical protein
MNANVKKILYVSYMLLKGCYNLVCQAYWAQHLPGCRILAF